MNIITICEGEKVYHPGKTNEVQALRRVNFCAEKGESVAVMGVSGSGKTTLLNILGCLDTLTGGEYVLDGKNIAEYDGARLAKIRNEQIGFVLQDYGLMMEDRVFDNVALPLYFGKKYEAKQMASRVQEILEKVGLWEELGDRGAKCRVAELSGGQRQRVAMARALVNDPEIILADEPTGALDSATAAHIVQLLLSAVQDGKTVIMVTHDREMAEKFSRTVEIRDGILG